MQLEEMELIYLYIERFGDFICQQELVLSHNFDVSLKNKKLIVRKKENHLKYFYGKKIKNLTVLVGKNGSGKTTILDILGMNRNDRLNIQEPRKQSKNEYFMLYYQDSYGSEREQLPYPDVYYKYLVINDCINGKIDAIKCNEAIVGFKDNIDYKYELAKQEFDDYRELLLEIEKTLCILNGKRTVTTFPKGYTQKEKYILDLYSRYIMDMLVTALSHVCFNAYKSEILKMKFQH